MANPKSSQSFKSDLNFFRIHLTVFIITPLIFSGIFFACNGQFHIAYIDSLFLCYSAMTVTGLTTVNLSSLTGWQQTILFVLMLAGDVTVVSFVMVLIRKHYFRSKLENIVKRKPRRRPEVLFRSLSRNISQLISPPTNGRPLDAEAPANGVAPKIQSELVGQQKSGFRVQEPTPQNTMLSEKDPRRDDNMLLQEESGENGVVRDANSFTSSPHAGDIDLPEENIVPASIHFNSQPGHDRQPSDLRRRNLSMHRNPTILSSNIPQEEVPYDLPSRRNRFLGGPPSIFQLIRSVLRRISPRTYAKLQRQLTMPYTVTYGDGPDKQDAKWLKLKAGLTITGNSFFHTDTLSDEDLEELGGVEYRALRVLGYVVGLYFVITQLITFVAVSIWLSRSGSYDEVFAQGVRPVPKAWFVAFNVVGAYTGGGMSLVDAGMVPFQRAYLMIILLGLCILAGNHALPIFLRLIIWIMTKLVKDGSREDETLHFLLDHPRRCYIYLFPSEVTWFLVAVLISLSCLELFAFCVLDTGLAVTDSLPLGVRVIDGLFQSLAVRASGFAIVSLSALAPAVQFLYVVMMYIAIYPVAMSIRSTNVYEERSLGVFEEPPEDTEHEPVLGTALMRRRDRVGKYVGWHIRRQLQYDLWWLVIGIWIVCIIERDRLMDDENAPWFNIFRIVFELVSAYGTIGLTLGIPTQNYSFSGACTPLSKLVIIVVMIRGRHRGLPVAVDRAVLLPQEYKRVAQDAKAKVEEKKQDLA